MQFAWQRSSVVEQRNHNPLVGGPNPSAATRINKRPNGSFFYSVRRGGDGHPDGGPTRRQKADGSMPVPRSFNEGEFAQGNEAQRNQSLEQLPEFKPPDGAVGLFFTCFYDITNLLFEFLLICRWECQTFVCFAVREFFACGL